MRINDDANDDVGDYVGANTNANDDLGDYVGANDDANDKWWRCLWYLVSKAH